MQIVVYIYRTILSLRYRVKLSGIELLNSKNPKLFLPNHQAIVDPQIIFTQLYIYTPIIPIVTETYFKIPLVKNILNLIKAVPVSDLTSGNRDTKVLQTIKDSVLIALKNNQSVLLYPSGQITDNGFEKIKNKKSAFSIVSEIPENVQIIAVRISGLWGSTWSKAINGKSPKFFNAFLKGIFIIIANFIFFVPKRNVNIEFIDITNELILKSKLNKDVFNSFLEDVFNVNNSNIPLKIRHFFYLKPKVKN